MTLVKTSVTKLAAEVGISRGILHGWIYCGKVPIPREGIKGAHTVVDDEVVQKLKIAVGLYKDGYRPDAALRKAGL